MGEENTHRFVVEIEAVNSVETGCIMQDMLDIAKLRGGVSKASWIDSDCTVPPSHSPALSTQVGGTHYKDLAIQPVEFCQRNHLGFCESAAIKYLVRHGSKGGAEDIKKAIHFLNLLLEIEYPESK